ncbi:hypothetical protein VIGAN_01305300 [Vigna angularis var. angularis]|uniref:Uncharacterized protein n=1 Tax=Vigna angularis var. angularis TaxID=157739 RepID=A0A0S3R3Z8_PHAAN|nr:hypothetical protein VIGAN_01305300 [Vigna angularis var. angularis]
MRSLPVSAMPITSTGGVPMKIFMRYSPPPGFIGACRLLPWLRLSAAALRWLMRLNERWKALCKRSKWVIEGS